MIRSKRKHPWSYILNENARILFVDDDPILTEFAQVNLSSPTATIEAVADGAAAWERLCGEPFDMVLLDIRMPVLGGFDLLERMRADARFRHLPVVMITGRDDIVAIDLAYELGATSFVTKPINWRQLSYQLRYLLRAVRLEAEVRSARDQAQELSLLKDNILSAMRHEMRAPLSSILDFSDLIMRQTDGPIPVRSYVDYAEQIHKAARRVQHAFRNIEHAQLDSGDDEFDEQDHGPGVTTPAAAPAARRSRPAPASTTVEMGTMAGAPAPARPAPAPRPSTIGDLPRFPGLRVLVADDSPVNREVALELLGRLGATTEIAQNGLQAANILAEQTFDAVLMDVSMPEMDGFEATRRIREEEAAAGRPSVPIAAVTGHWVESAVDAWRDAGMNAILYKPFTIRTLAGCLGILVSAKAPTAPEQHPASAAAEPGAAATLTEEEREGTALLDTDLLERLDSASRPGPSNFVKRVFELYLEHAPNTASELIRSFAAGGFEATGRAAHALKSMSYNIGAKRVAAIADDMEKRAQSDGQKITNADIAELLRALNETYDAIGLRMKGATAEVARAS